MTEFERIYREYFTDVELYLRAICKDASLAEELTEQGFKKDDSKYYDVRHILICPEGGTSGENGETIYTVAEWDACRAEAQALLDQWSAESGTEEGFAQFAMENTEDPGSMSTGGLYTGVTEGYMVAEFNDWIFDESRQYGDSDLVKTQFGYHIMYFVKREANWIAKSREGYFSIAVNEAISDVKEQYPIEVNYDAIALS